jgi:hypothetical protein
VLDDHRVAERERFGREVLIDPSDGGLGARFEQEDGAVVRDGEVVHALPPCGLVNYFPKDTSTRLA